MTNTRAIELLKIERECINRNNQPFGKNCNRECSKCDLVQNTEELLEMYDFVIEHFADADKKIGAEGMSWKNYDTDEVITDTEMEDVCTACKCFCSEGTLSIGCDGIKENCPYYKHIK